MFVVFVLLGFLALQFKISHLAGSKATFTLFDSFAPTAGAFLGGLPGALAVLLMQALNFVWHKTYDLGFIIRLIPPVFAVLYFTRKTKLNIIVPIIAIILFNLNPIGRTVWFYSLFWLIPVVCYFYQDKFLLARAFGTTFTAHAVGGALWVYAFHLPREVWIALIPVVIIERALFGAGIAINYALLKRLSTAIQKNVYAVH
jgi:hypothetical protein